MANWPYTINPTPTVHKGGWIAHPVQLQVSIEWETLALKCLDINIILNNTSSTQLDILSNDSQRLTLRIATKRASATVEAIYYNQYVLPEYATTLVN